MNEKARKAPLPPSRSNGFRYLSFGFLSAFEFRISDFEVRISSFVRTRGNGLHDGRQIDLVTGQFTNFLSVTQHYHAMTVANHFLQFRRDEQYRHAFAAQSGDQLLNFRLRPDVDAARRLVENKKAWVRRQLARKDRFLLIAATKPLYWLLGVRRRDAQRFDVVLSQLLLLLRGNLSEPSLARLKREHNVLAH